MSTKSKRIVNGYGRKDSASDLVLPDNEYLFPAESPIPATIQSTYDLAELATTPLSDVPFEGTFPATHATVNPLSDTISGVSPRPQDHTLGSVKVFVRIRPFTDTDKSFSLDNSINAGQPIQTVHFDSSNPACITVLDPAKGYAVKETYVFERCFSNEDFHPQRDPTLFPVGTSPGSSQEEVYIHVGRPVLKNALDGFNGCVFAYGQTGSGKTFTMMGPPLLPSFDPRQILPSQSKDDIFIPVSIMNTNKSSTTQEDCLSTPRYRGETPVKVLTPVKRQKSSRKITTRVENSFSRYASVSARLCATQESTPVGTCIFSEPILDGIIPRIIKEMFQELQKKRESDCSHSFRLQAEYYEIYNEKVIDLLRSNSSNAELKVRQGASGPYVEGLKSKCVEGLSSVLKLLKKGNTERHTATTKMNDRSSRSHAVLCLNLLQMKIDEYGNSSVVKSKVNLVDLAGSERVGASDVAGKQFREATRINLSLTTLGRVIDALADQSQGKNAFCPYRDSMLTWLLMDSLGGNSRTTMIATISPNPDHFEETCQTLRYASRAKQIVTKAIVNEDPQVRIIKDLRAEVERLERLLKNSGTDPLKSDYTSDYVEELRDRVIFLEKEVQGKDIEISKLSAELKNTRAQLGSISALQQREANQETQVKPKSKPSTTVKESNALKASHRMYRENLKASADREQELTKQLEALKEDHARLLSVHAVVCGKDMLKLSPTCEEKLKQLHVSFSNAKGWGALIERVATIALDAQSKHSNALAQTDKATTSVLPEHKKEETIALLESTLNGGKKLTRTQKIAKNSTAPSEEGLQSANDKNSGPSAPLDGKKTPTSLGASVRGKKKDSETVPTATKVPEQQLVAEKKDKTDANDLLETLQAELKQYKDENTTLKAALEEKQRELDTKVTATVVRSSSTRSDSVGIAESRNEAPLNSEELLKVNHISNLNDKGHIDPQEVLKLGEEISHHRETITCLQQQKDSLEQICESQKESIHSLEEKLKLQIEEQTKESVEWHTRLQDESGKIKVLSIEKDREMERVTNEMKEEAQKKLRDLQLENEKKVEDLVRLQEMKLTQQETTSKSELDALRESCMKEKEDILRSHEAAVSDLREQLSREQTRLDASEKQAQQRQEESKQIEVNLSNQVAELQAALQMQAQSHAKEIQAVEEKSQFKLHALSEAAAQEMKQSLLDCLKKLSHLESSIGSCRSFCDEMGVSITDSIFNPQDRHFIDSSSNSVRVSGALDNKERVVELDSSNKERALLDHAISHLQTFVLELMKKCSGRCSSLSLERSELLASMKSTADESSKKIAFILSVLENREFSFLEELEKEERQSLYEKIRQLKLFSILNESNLSIDACNALSLLFVDDRKANKVLASTEDTHTLPSFSCKPNSPISVYERAMLQQYHGLILEAYSMYQDECLNTQAWLFGELETARAHSSDEINSLKKLCEKLERENQNLLQNVMTLKENLEFQAVLDTCNDEFDSADLSFSARSEFRNKKASGSEGGGLFSGLAASWFHRKNPSGTSGAAPTFSAASQNKTDSASKRKSSNVTDGLKFFRNNSFSSSSHKVASFYRDTAVSSFDRLPEDLIEGVANDLKATHPGKQPLSNS